MLRALLPYFIVGLVMSGAAGFETGRGHLSVLGSYGVVTVATLIMVFGCALWEHREHGSGGRRR